MISIPSPSFRFTGYKGKIPPDSQLTHQKASFFSKTEAMRVAQCKIFECGTAVLASCAQETGILFTRVGDPLVDGSEDLRCGPNPDIGLTAAWSLSVAVSVDNDAVEPVLGTRDVLESLVNLEGVAELGPEGARSTSSLSSLDIGCGSGFESRAEVSREASCDSR